MKGKSIIRLLQNIIKDKEDFVNSKLGNQDLKDGYLMCLKHFKEILDHLNK